MRMSQLDNICDWIFAVFGTIEDRNMSDVEGDVPSAAPVEATGPMGINEAIQEVLKQVSAFLPISLLLFPLILLNYYAKSSKWTPHPKSSMPFVETSSISRLWSLMVLPADWGRLPRPWTRGRPCSASSPRTATSPCTRSLSPLSARWECFTL